MPRAVASPSAAHRPWPTCRGPVGFAEMYSRLILRSPSGMVPRPKSPFSARAWAATPCRADGARRMLMKPGPAISTLCTRSFSGRWSTMIWAISRGFFLASLAERVATVDAQSPLASSRGRSSAASGACSSSSDPSLHAAATAASISCSSCSRICMVRIFPVRYPNGCISVDSTTFCPHGGPARRLPDKAWLLMQKKHT